MVTTLVPLCSTHCSREGCSWDPEGIFPTVPPPHKCPPVSWTSLTQELLNITWKFRQMEGKSCFLQPPCALHHEDPLLLRYPHTSLNTASGAVADKPRCSIRFYYFLLPTPVSMLMELSLSLSFIYFPATACNRCQEVCYPLSWPRNHKRLSLWVFWFTGSAAGISYLAAAWEVGEPLTATSQVTAENCFNEAEIQCLKSQNIYKYHQIEYRGKIKQQCCEYSCASALFPSSRLPEM